jgi:hypothetical protein
VLFCVVGLLRNSQSAVAVDLSVSVVRTGQIRWGFNRYFCLGLTLWGFMFGGNGWGL